MNTTGKETLADPSGRSSRSESSPSLYPALIVAWSQSEPDRVGEVLLLDSGKPELLGRFDEDYEYEHAFALPRRQRPGRNTTMAALDLPQYVSRLQLRLEPVRSATVLVTNLGKARVLVNGERLLATDEQVELLPGDTLGLADHALFLSSPRPKMLERSRYQDADVPFGRPDPHGLVGESPESWELREQVAFSGQLGQHILVHGPSGSGKELVARGVHEMSSRGGRPLVSHSASEIPATLIEAELFGNRKDYPNPGTPEREGLIGQADGSSILLDELGMLPVDLQGKLLRVLDDHGEYRRLGFDELQRSDFRLIAATNRSIDELKHDLLGRLKLSIEVPGLNDRRADIPLLALHLLRAMMARRDDARVVERFVSIVDGFRAQLELIDALIRHRYTLNMRELEQLLLLALYGSKGDEIRLTADVQEKLNPIERRTTPAPGETDCAAVEKSLVENDWNISKAAQALGWSRFQLNRKMKICGIEKPA